ncbi:Sec14p-like phosphatidylinositol transfer family protein [Rhynchospora pubera]|uniref:Sec14p-like phosphatidylinositol transfer family protein n=1 Tax=Rhynchospora pubera TaxID=906938 RepID=A0AAV8CR32_9POAL|nr:Sec14p-like phosphatidylinositol transfer family protein [Rhynchospora pubera]
MEQAAEEAIQKLSALIDQADATLKSEFEIMHQGYPTETMARFLKARDWNVDRAHKMLLDCLNWRIENDIDDILSKPIVPTDLFRSVRESQLYGMSGFSKDGIPVFALGVGRSSYDKASVHYYVQSHIQINEYRDRVVLPAASKKHGRLIHACIKVLDMTGLRLTALSQMKQILTTISTVDDLNYPEKTETYYIVNAPYVFSACWRVVKPLLQERTRKKVQVLNGCGRDELLKIMDPSSLPHVCRKEGSGSSRRSTNSDSVDDCYSAEHWFHQEMYNYMKQQSEATEDPVAPIKQGSFHVAVPEPNPEGSKVKIVKTIEAEVHKIADQNGLEDSVKGLELNNR